MPQVDEHGAAAVGDEKQPPTEPQVDPETGEPVDADEEAAYQRQRAESFERIQSALDRGQLPLDELRHFPVEVSVGGEKRQVSLEEAIGGYQRRADYTRKLEESHALSRQAQHILQLERARNNEWRDHRQLRHGLKLLGLEESFVQAAHAYAEERVAYMRLPQSERALMDRLQAEQDERARMQDAMRQQQMQAQQNAGPDPVTQHVAKQIEQLMPAALRRHSIGQYPLAHKLFLQQLQAFCPDGNVDAQRCDEAALATKEMLQDMARYSGAAGGQPAGQQQVYQAPPQNPGGYPLGARRLASGPYKQLQPMQLGQFGGGGGQQPRGGQGRRPSDFLRRMGMG